MGKQTPKTNWAYETVPQAGLNGRRGYQPRGRGLGGSSAINAMLYVRGAAWDYDNWAALGCDGWSYADVLPVFKRAEANERGASEYHGGDGPLRVSDQRCPHPGSVEFVEAGASLQIPRNDDFNGAAAGRRRPLSSDAARTANAGPRRAAMSSRRAAAPISSIVTDATAERVLFEDGKVWGVAYTRGREQRVIRAKKVVLAGGVFGTPQLLMLSGIGPAAHLAEHGIKPLVDRPASAPTCRTMSTTSRRSKCRGAISSGQSFAGNLAMMGAIDPLAAQARGRADLAVRRGRRVPDADARRARARRPVPFRADRARGSRPHRGQGARLFVPRLRAPPRKPRHGAAGVGRRARRAADRPGVPERRPRHGGDEGRGARDVPHPRTARRSTATARRTAIRSTSTTTTRSTG